MSIRRPSFAGVFFLVFASSLFYAGVAQAGTIGLTESGSTIGEFEALIFDNGTIYSGGVPVGVVPGRRVLAPNDGYVGTAPGPPIVTPPPYTTPDGNFSIVATIVTNNLGVAGVAYQFGAVVTDLTGVQGSIELDVTQNYDIPGAVDFPGWLVQPQLIGNFVDGLGSAPGSHGNDVRVGALIGGSLIDTLVAQDRFGPNFNLLDPVTVVNPPSQIVNTLTFEFLGTPAAGDAIVVPSGLTFDLTVTPPIPEPASMVMLGTGLLGLGALQWRRRRPRP